MKRSMLIAVLLLFASLVHAQDGLKPFVPLRTDRPPIIDGDLNDQVWKDAPFETGFKTWYPDYGIEMVENTKVWYAYDRENLYFAFKCFDSQPDKIKSSVTSRDNIRSDDWICINLDTFNDQQGLYAFYINPIGIQGDSRAVGDNEDESIDMVWYSEGRIIDDGYSVEIKIPFKSIRYSNTNPVEMGVIFERRISRRSEMGTYPPLDPKQGPNFYTQTRTLLFKDIEKYQLFELLPAVTYGKNSSIKPYSEGKLISDGDESDLSLTAKYGITSHLVLDGTLNPDFSQVEADAGQIDFDVRYAPFYAEKRPFFLEGRDMFTYGGYTGGDPLGAIVHTRNIANPKLGLKLTGKIGEKNTIATIYALDDLPEYRQEGEDAHFSILRYRRSLDQDSFLGGVFTGREVEDGYNRVAGVDGQIRVTPSARIGFHGFLSQNKVNEQTAKENGHAVGINYYHYTRDMHMNIRLHDLSEDFNTESGYLTRTGVTRIRAGVLKMYYPKSDFFKRIDPMFNTMPIYDKAGDEWEVANSFDLTFVLPRSSNFRLGYIKSNEIYEREKFDTSYFRVITSSQFTKQFYFYLSYFYGNKIRYIQNPYQGKGNTASVNLRYQPSDKIYSSLSYTYKDFYRDSDDQKEYDYAIVTSNNSFQLNKYLFFRGIFEYNSYYKELMTDFLASFTYIPGTVVHLGYGSLYEKIKWAAGGFTESDRFLETKRGFFFKTSYLWRM